MDTAAKLLDEIFKTLTNVGPAPTLSETNEAYLRSLTILRSALVIEYGNGKAAGIKEIKSENIKKQQNQN